jgi:hypothetical protein
MERDPRFEEEKPYLFMYPLDNGTFPSNLKHESRDRIIVRNLRDHVPSYDESGIGLLNLRTGLEHDDYDDADKVEKILLPKIRDTLRVFLGANTVHILEYKVYVARTRIPPRLTVTTAEKARSRFSAIYGNDL